ncbi:MAG: DUF3667 domain-containing protein [Alphaproteobacteria bacterium]|nr:DUF3667 domain-containing protein [Alphaproteobacteria bacterium]
MSGELEAAGAAVTAGIAASALEGKSGARAHDHDGACLNCETPLTGAYCAVCGQPAHISRTLGDVAHDLLHGVLHFDNKAWKTLPLLIFRPGELTRRYVHGQRARFVGPVALFLFTVFVMFFVFALIGESRIGVSSTQSATEQAAQAAEIDEALSDLSQEIARAETSGDAEELAAARMSQRILQRARDSGRLPAGVVLSRGENGEDVNVTVAATGEGGMDAIFEEIRTAQKEGRIHVNTHVPAWDHKIEEKLANPEFAWYKIQNAAYKFSFLLVPLSVPLVWLAFFWRRGVTLFDHTIFVLYSLSFVSLVFIASAVLSRVQLPVFRAVAEGLWLTLPVHMFFQLSGAYGLGWFSALWRTVYLLFAASLALSVFLTLIFLFGLLG